LVSGIVGTNTAISGLVQGTAYEFRVRSVCTAAQSAFGASFPFTTLVPCPDALEPNNTLATAADIVLPATVSALIASPSDQDHYRLVLSQAGGLSIQLSGLAGDYDLRLLSSTGSQLAISQNGGTNGEFINYAAGAGTYVVQVYGYNGAFSPELCYALSVNFFASTCVTPDGLSAVDVSWYQAEVEWPAVQGASGYDLQWREVGQPAWNTITMATNVHALLGLQPSTEHEARVRTRCTGIGGTQGGTFSDYTGIIAFTTLAVPCEVQAPTTVLVRMLLDAAYNEGNSLMRDALRIADLIPIEEPYTSLGLPVTGITSLDPALLQVSGPDAVVDWVLIELRDPLDPAFLVERRAGLLLRNGTVVRPDNGLQLLPFCAPPGSYHVAVRHRNHLGCMTANTWALGPLGAPIFFKDEGFSTWGNGAQRSRSGSQLLWSGNSIADTNIKYTGQDNDRDMILETIGGLVPTTTIAGYHPADNNLDGLVKFTGQDNDRDVILLSVGGVVPTAVRTEQLP